MLKQFLTVDGRFICVCDLFDDNLAQHIFAIVSTIYFHINPPANQPANKPKYFNCLAMESCCSAVSAINSSTMDLFGIPGMHQNLPGIDKRGHTYSLSLLSIKVTCFIQNTAMRQRIIINQAHMPATKFHALWNFFSKIIQF